jgi:hypothetical protein
MYANLNSSISVLSQNKEMRKKMGGSAKIKVIGIALGAA